MKIHHWLIAIIIVAGIWYWVKNKPMDEMPPVKQGGL
jgi:hypothetical protein